MSNVEDTKKAVFTELIVEKSLSGTLFDKFMIRPGVGTQNDQESQALLELGRLLPESDFVSLQRLCKLFCLFVENNQHCLAFETIKIAKKKVLLGGKLSPLGDLVKSLHTSLEYGTDQIQNLKDELEKSEKIREKLQKETQLLGRKFSSLVDEIKDSKDKCSTLEEKRKVLEKESTNLKKLDEELQIKYDQLKEDNRDLVSSRSRWKLNVAVASLLSMIFGGFVLGALIWDTAEASREISRLVGGGTELPELINSQDAAPLPVVEDPPEPPSTEAKIPDLPPPLQLPTEQPPVVVETPVPLPPSLGQRDESSSASKIPIKTHRPRPVLGRSGEPFDK